MLCTEFSHKKEEFDEMSSCHQTLSLNLSGQEREKLQSDVENLQKYFRQVQKISNEKTNDLNQAIGKRKDLWATAQQVAINNLPTFIYWLSSKLYSSAGDCVVGTSPGISQRASFSSSLSRYCRETHTRSQSECCCTWLFCYFTRIDEFLLTFPLMGARQRFLLFKRSTHPSYVCLSRPESLNTLHSPSSVAHITSQPISSSPNS